MNIVKILLLPLLLFLFASIGNCQEGDTEAYEFPGEVSYSKAKIYLPDNSRFELSDLTISKDHLTYKRKGHSQISERDLQDVYIIKVSEGSHAGRYALYGGLTFGLSGLLAVVQVENDPNTDVDLNGGLFVGGFTAAGVLLGGIIGSTQTRWGTLYMNEQSNLFTPSGLAVSFNPDRGQLRIGLQFAMSRGGRK